MLTLPSNPANICKLESFIEEVAQRYDVTPDIYGNILVSLTEAVTNAIKHGNQNDESKYVEVKLRKGRNKLAFSVSDEGKGFDFNSVPDPTAPENLLKIGGRGVFLMKQLSDMVVFRNQGSTVEMEFAL